MSIPTLTAVLPPRAIEGGRITLVGKGFPVHEPQALEVLVHEQRARVVFASSRRISVLVPSGVVDAGPAPVRIVGVTGMAGFVEIAVPVATGLHQVDSPVMDADGNLYLTYSGTRGQQVPVSIFRVGASGTRETYSSGIVNPTSLAFDRDGRLYASSRFEGVVYRLASDGTAEPFATDLGIACGLAFAPDGTLFVGDRTGTIFAVDRSGHPTSFASLPSSVAAFHLALGPDALYVTGPTLSSYDAVYRIRMNGNVEVFSRAFGRPQGLAFGPDGALLVVEALAGASGLYCVSADAEPELVLSGPGLVGVAFDRAGGLIVCSNDTAYRLRESRVQSAPSPAI